MLKDYELNPVDSAQGVNSLVNMVAMEQLKHQAIERKRAMDYEWMQTFNGLTGVDKLGFLFRQGLQNA